MLNGVVHKGPVGHTIENCHVEMLYCVGALQGDGVLPAVLLEKDVDFPLTKEQHTLTYPSE